VDMALVEPLERAVHGLLAVDEEGGHALWIPRTAISCALPAVAS
jgi:hypothetical protein